MKKRLLFLLTMICCGICSGCSSNEIKINVNDYAVVKPIGYDGYGSIEYKIDYESMFAQSNASQSKKATALEITEQYDLCTLKDNRFQNLKNGDSIEIEWEIDKNIQSVLNELLKIKFEKPKAECEIKGLKTIEQLDPFEYLVSENHESISGEGILDFKIAFSKNGHDVLLNVKHDGENGKLKNGDVVELSIENIDNEWFKRNVGFDVIKTTSEYVISDLAEYANSENALNCISKNNEQSINQVVDEWILSGLNDMEDSNEIEKRTKEHIGYVYYCDDNGVGMLNSIYKIHDYFCGDYYSFIGLKGAFQYDNNGWLKDGESFPEMFIHYEKEKTRQSSDGVPQGNCEEMGFYSNDRLFAGKRNLEQTLMFLNDKYGTNYQHCFVSVEALNKAIDLKKGS